jgi:hypothetical protein
MLGMDRSEYQSYIRSRAWSEVKARYRASNLPQKCVVCLADRVELHHRTYARLGHERLTDLVPLCRDHHKEAHVLRERIDEKRVKLGKERVGSCRTSPLATAKQLAYIVRLGGVPRPEMTNKEARRMAQRLQKAAARG